MTDERLTFSPDYAVPPGETLREVLDELGMTQAELAERTGRPSKTISQIVNGKKAITPKTAIEFERALGVPARFWMSREANYQTTKARLAEGQRLLNQEADRVKDFPYAEMAKLGWVPETRKRIQKAQNLLSFFGVASFAALDQRPAAIFRVAQSREPSYWALTAWLRQGQLLAHDMETASFDKAKLREAVPTLRAMTCGAPREFVPELTGTLARCGVALVVLPHLKKTYAHGATQWLTSDKALIELSLRCKWADIFWFSFFHELAHLLLHRRTEGVFVNRADVEPDELEMEANMFAADTLIRSEDFERIRQLQPLRGVAVREAAKSLGIHPGIVVGRLQHEGLVARDKLNSLRTRFESRSSRRG